VRKTREVTVQAEGRDKGKVFLLTEKSAMDGDDWARRALSIASRSGVDLPEDWASGGMLTFATVGFRALLSGPEPEIKALLAELLECVKIKEAAFELGRPCTPDDIEEIATVSFLRDEVIDLHVGFRPVAFLLGMATALIQIATTAAGGGDTQTSAAPPAQSSEPDLQP
jgi:hypothetical protein